MSSSTTTPSTQVSLINNIVPANSALSSHVPLTKAFLNTQTLLKSKFLNDRVSGILNLVKKESLIGKKQILVPFKNINSANDVKTILSLYLPDSIVIVNSMNDTITMKIDWT